MCNQRQPRHAVFVARVFAASDGVRIGSFLGASHSVRQVGAVGVDLGALGDLAPNSPQI